MLEPTREEFMRAIARGIDQERICGGDDTPAGVYSAREWDAGAISALCALVLMTPFERRAITLLGGIILLHEDGFFTQCPEDDDEEES
jgi:hypothetical protein